MDRAWDLPAFEDSLKSTVVSLEPLNLFPQAIYFALLLQTAFA
jgi:hypothetical protein